MSLIISIAQRTFGVDIALVRAAAADIIKAVRKPDIWMAIGWLDVKQRYRRSILGPFWITLSVAAFVLGLGLVYGSIFGQPLSEYLPYVGVGLIGWMLVAALINDGCAAFTSADGAIKQVAIPLSVHVLRTVWKNFIITAHHSVVIVFLIVAFGVPIGWHTFLVVPAIVNIAIFGVALSFGFGIISARFRDVPLMITNMVMLVFFITPIIWKAEALPPNRAIIAQFNPFHYIISTFRDPLLGVTPPLSYWIITLFCTLIAVITSFILFARFRTRIAYWL
jgi:ABC-2 type transport system permease protein/lipopolysaccharide transport system permease protein